MSAEQTNPEAEANLDYNVVDRRIVAALIDLALMVALLIAMSSVFGQAETDSNQGFSIQFNLTGGPAILYFLIGFAYYVALEGLTGATLGKRVMGLRVVKLEGAYGLGPSLLRNILRFIDFLPFLYIVGIVTIAITKKKQRIGDMAAGTVVVRAV